MCTYKIDVLLFDVFII